MLIERIKLDRIMAMRNKDKFKRDFLGTFIGDACKDDKNPHDDKVVAMLKKFIANSELTQKEAIRAGRDDLVIKSQWEISALEVYLPAQLSEEDLKSIIKEYIELGHETQGGINKLLKSEFGGMYDGKMANEIIKQMI